MVVSSFRTQTSVALGRGGAFKRGKAIAEKFSALGADTNFFQNTIPSCNMVETIGYGAWRTYEQLVNMPQLRNPSNPLL
jgi:hypothetical protein